MNKDHIKNVVDETLEMFPEYDMNDTDKKIIVEHFTKIESSDRIGKSPAAIQMIQSVIFVKMLLSNNERKQQC